MNHYILQNGTLSICINVSESLGTALWGLVQANIRLGYDKEARRWMQRLAQDYSYHQIYDPDGQGYWNALVGWKASASKLGEFYNEFIKKLEGSHPARRMRDKPVDHLQLMPKSVSLTPLAAAFS